MKSKLIATRKEQKQETRPEPIRVIRQGQWVILQSEAEMTPSEKREMYCRMFAIYA